MSSGEFHSAYAFHRLTENKTPKVELEPFTSVWSLSQRLHPYSVFWVEGHIFKWYTISTFLSKISSKNFFSDVEQDEQLLQPNSGNDSLIKLTQKAIPSFNIKYWWYNYTVIFLREFFLVIKLRGSHIPTILTFSLWKYTTDMS